MWDAQENVINRRTIKFFLFVFAIMIAISCSCSKREPVKRRYVKPIKQKSIKDYANDLKKELVDFKAQVPISQKACENAEAARKKAIDKKGNMVFSRPETKEFIKQWRNAETEVRNLQKKNYATTQIANVFFKQCYIKAGLEIKNEKIHQTVAKLIQKKQIIFMGTLNKAKQSIQELTKIIQNGNDIITGLEIIGALGIIENKEIELEDLNKIAKEKLPDIEKLVEEGMRILNSDLKSFVDDN